MKPPKIVAADLRPGDMWQRSDGMRVELGAINQIGKNPDDWGFQCCLLGPAELFSLFASRFYGWKELKDLIGDGVKAEKKAEPKVQL